MNDAEMAEFEAHPMACEALRVRRWDDEAKDPGLSPPAFGYYQPLLRRLLRTGLARPAARGPAAPPAASGRRQTSTTTGMIIGRRR
jgi:hypothetical protein